MSYSYLRPAVNLNEGFEASTGTAAWDNWIESAGVLEKRGAGAYGGSGKSARVPDGESIYQDMTFVTPNGRSMDEKMDLLMDFYGKPSAGYIDGPFFQVFLYTLGALTYAYDFHNREWVDATSLTEATSPGYWVPMLDTIYADWTKFTLPRIVAAAEAGAEVADTYTLRMKVSVTNDAGTGALDIDEWRLSYAPTQYTAEKIGRYITLGDGINYPLKYDTLTGDISELSLHPPYAGTNTLPSTTTTSTGGFLTDSHYYGYLYIFIDDSLSEYSAAPLGVAVSSGVYTEQAPASGSNVGKITNDFQSLVIPNTDATPTTDNADITSIALFRTHGYAKKSDAENDLVASLVYFEGTCDATGSGATIDSTLSDVDLETQGIMSDFGFGAQQQPAPHYSVAYSFRSRLWVGGGRDFSDGRVTATNGSVEVVGVAQGGAAPATNWGRSLVGMTVRMGSDTREYDIEDYWYPDDDGSTTSIERIILTEAYEGVTGTYSYIARPKRGRIWFSEEGAANAFSNSGFLLLDGSEGEEVTLIGHGGVNLIACTPHATFSFNYQDYPSEAGQTMQAISRDLGCIAPGSMVEVDGLAYWLSERGPVVCDGSSARLVDGHLRDMFTDPNDESYIPRRRSTGLVEASGAHLVKDQAVLWSVRTKARENLVLVYNYIYQTWDILEYRHRIDSLVTVDDAAGDPRVLLQDEFGYTWKIDVGAVDGAGEVNNHGQLVGQVQSASKLALILSSIQSIFTGSMSQNFASASTGLDGAYLKIIGGTGAGQVRRIDVSEGATVYINEAWDTEPDTTSIWELGGIDWVWRFKHSDLGMYANVKRLKFLQVQQPESITRGVADVKFYPNRSAIDWATQQDIEPARIALGRDGRSATGASDAAGYTIAVEISGSGPENPVEIVGLSATMELGEQD